MHGYTIQALPEQFWRVFAAIFIHIGLEHFVVNMLTLYFLGRQIEAIFGSWKFFDTLPDVRRDGEFICGLFFTQ